MMEGDGIDVRFLKPEDGVFLHTHQPDRYPDPDFVFFVDRDQPNRRVTRRDLIFLRRDVDRIKAAPADKPLDPRERATWARIVRVLAAEADLDLKQHTKAAGVLATMATQRGLALDGRLDTTISDKLKLARDIDK